MTDPKVYPSTDAEIEQVRLCGEKLAAQGVTGIKRKNVSLAATLRFLVDTVLHPTTHILLSDEQLQRMLTTQEGHKVTAIDFSESPLPVGDEGMRIIADGKGKLILLNPDGSPFIYRRPIAESDEKVVQFNPPKKSGRLVGRFVLTYLPDGRVRATSLSGIDIETFDTEAEAESYAGTH